MPKFNVTIRENRVWEHVVEAATREDAIRLGIDKTYEDYGDDPASTNIDANECEANPATDSVKLVANASGEDDVWHIAMLNTKHEHGFVSQWYVEGTPHDLSEAHPYKDAQKITYETNPVWGLPGGRHTAPINGTRNYCFKS